MADDERLTPRQRLDAAFEEQSPEGDDPTVLPAQILCTVYYLLLDETPPVIKKLLAGTPTTAITVARSNNQFSDEVVGYDAELRREFIVWVTEMANRIAADEVMSAQLAHELDYNKEVGAGLHSDTLGKDDEAAD